MHLGAVIASKDGNFIITDMSEEDTVVNSPIVAKELSGTNLLSGFRGAEYGDAGVYKFGVLICDAGGDGKFIAALRQKYEASGAEIIDEPLSESSDSEA
jgi:hypothetical protein